MMTKDDLSEWWSGLAISEKERIASKIASKRAGKAKKVTYPECTVVWNSLNQEQQEKVYAHCTDDHGLLLAEYKMGDTYSF